MATYKLPCLRCGEFIGRDSRLCPKCGSRNPFGFQCPNCLKPVERGDAVCSGCGRALITACPYCMQPVFAGGAKCEACGKTLHVRCDNKRCGELQFFENNKCTVCGKKIKSAKKQIELVQKGGQ